ncbi:DUF1772 domain-containing protein [filamentous cyanobacterium LEGE 11480]|uniref:DUF1772 domain-containing protein n=1 Tax=Romeriopsis navalis LEGE 11480 TaxID=2777977 RepID=A0A928Z379_9CYAN|nr:anthrone oxygenase family protein [Romeriopsis navalis]MBE9030364.1 DUF1772 domain-containing protein [Romeriopsis navalis LEGE 11480]
MATVHNLRFWLMLLTALCSALSAGIFFAFSTFVMQALAQQPPAQGIATMQSINITVFTPWFMAAFFGPAVLGIILTLVLLPQWPHLVTVYWLAGTLIYLIGTIGVTVLGNIPLNDALAIVTPDSTEGLRLWAKYLNNWTLWNHARTAAAAISAVLLAIALCEPAQ